jgi:hypothetical protein
MHHVKEQYELLASIATSIMEKLQASATTEDSDMCGASLALISFLHIGASSIKTSHKGVSSLQLLLETAAISRLSAVCTDIHMSSHERALL